jgi:hypothetical protein
MNAYPPPIYVRRGPYRFTRHPIYVGFGMVCFGSAMGVGSASGLWLVSPLAALGMAALVLGYEGEDLRRRFGDGTRTPPLLSLPPDESSRVTGWQRLSVVLLVFLPWTLAYEAVYRLGIPPDAVEAYLPFERHWPVWVWTEAVYASVYPFVVLVPFCVPEARVLRRFALRGLLATAVVSLVYVTVPLVAPPRPFQGGGLLGEMLRFERAMSNTVAAFPAFHVIWTLLAADAWSDSFRRARATAWLWAVAISLSCLSTGMHALADLFAAVLVWVGVRSSGSVWAGLRLGAERVANSWREWRVGRARVLVYGIYAGAAGGIGSWITASMAGSGQRIGVLIVLVSSLIGAGLWAQRLEGSSALSRPFGYFGSLVGAGAGAGIAGWAGHDPSLLFAAIALAAPWVQAVGRLRCLVQGCCHGREAPECVGIRYHDPRSRVCSLGSLRGHPLHPTPLYSIISNVVVGVLLARLWILGATEGLVIGLYLILSGITRFVEESYRGEPQTPWVAGLRLYQWLSVVMVVVGALVTCVASSPVPDTWLDLSVPVLLSSLGFGALCLLALGRCSTYPPQISPSTRWKLPPRMPWMCSSV